MAEVRGGLVGTRQMLKKLRDFKEQFPKQMVRALMTEGVIEVTEVKKRTPVYVGPPGPGKPIPGLLRDSVHLEIEQQGKKITAFIVAGGAAGAYAIPQHENLEYFHEVGEAKYIESVINESRSHMAERLAYHLDFSKVL